MRRYICLISAIYVAFMILANCAGSQGAFHSPTSGLDDGRFDDKPVYTALMLLPLSGLDEKMGHAMQQAAEMAFFDLADDHLQLRFLDTKSDPKFLKTALSNIDGNKIDLMIGPLRSNTTEVAKKFSKKYRLPMLSFSNNAAIADERTYIMGFTPEDQVQKIMHYALQKGYKNFGALLPDTAYGHIVFAAMQNSLAESKVLSEEEASLDLEKRSLTKAELMIKAVEAYLQGEDPTLIEESSEALPLLLEKKKIEMPHIAKVTFYNRDSEIAALQNQVKAFADYDERREAFQEKIKPYAFLVEIGESLLEKDEAAGPEDLMGEAVELTPQEKFVRSLIERYGMRAYYANKRYFEAHGKDETDGSSPYDAILMADSGKKMQMVAALLPYYEISPQQTQFLGTGLWDDDKLGEEWALRGALFAAPDPTAQNQFEKRYQKLYGEPAIRLNSLAYDAVALASYLVRNNAVDPFDRKYLLDPSGFVGIDGLFHFNLNGTVERSLVIMKITKKGPIPIAKN